LQNVCSQLITNPSLIPDGPREQALQAIRTGLLGVFRNLPAIFSGDRASDGLQIEQSVLAWFRASKVGSQALMQLEQGQRPSSYLLQRWSAFMVCGMVERLHAFLFSDGSLFKGGFVLCSVSHREREMHEAFFIGGIYGSG
jgi:hypothetical protein